MSQTGSAASYSYAANSNRLQSFTAGAASTSVGYDSAGNIVSLTPSHGSATSLSFDGTERLAAVTLGTATKGSYTYDAFGQRAIKVAAGVTGRFVYRSGMVLEEQDLLHSTTTTLDTVYLGDQPLADINATTGAVYYLHTDRLGTPQVATTTTGATAWRASYAPFGAATVGTGLLTQNLRFPGQYADTATAFYQNGFRDYDPALGRYVESDPAGLVGGMNTYAYVEDDPTNLKDPSGRWPLFLPGQNTAIVQITQGLENQGISPSVAAQIAQDATDEARWSDISTAKSLQDALQKGQVPTPAQMVKINNFINRLPQNDQGPLQGLLKKVIKNY